MDLPTLFDCFSIFYLDLSTFIMTLDLNLHLKHESKTKKWQVFTSNISFSKIILDHSTSTLSINIK